MQRSLCKDSTCRKSRCWGESPELRPRPAGRSDLPGTAGDLSFTGTRAELGHVGLGGQRSGTSLHSVLGFPLGGPRVTVCVCVLRSRVQHPRTTCVHVVPWKEGRKEGGPWCCRWEQVNERHALSFGN